MHYGTFRIKQVTKTVIIRNSHFQCRIYQYPWLLSAGTLLTEQVSWQVHLFGVDSCSCFEVAQFQGSTAEVIAHIFICALAINSFKSAGSQNILPPHFNLGKKGKICKQLGLDSCPLAPQVTSLTARPLFFQIKLFN